MRTIKLNLITSIVLLAMLFSGCKKDQDILSPGTPATPVPPPPANSFTVKVKAVIGIGNLIYDSIPATLTVTSWDNQDIQFQKVINLTAGSNNISLNRDHLRYKLSLEKWGIRDEMSFTKENMQEGTTISLGGTKAAKKLKLTEEYLLVEGVYHPKGKSVYTYNQYGNLDNVMYYQKKPQYADLQLTVKDLYTYIGNRVDAITRLDNKEEATGLTVFEYTPQQKMINIHQRSYDVETSGHIQYDYNGTRDIIKINYLYNNGNSLEYNMEFLGGNKVKEKASSSTGGGEQATYTYDFNINPFAHMNMPDIHLSNLSKNNITGQQRNYSGAIPSGVPYQYQYTYDNDGYPAELILSYKSYVTGQHLYSTKTLFTY